jgi:hypothetical protein
VGIKLLKSLNLHGRVQEHGREQVPAHGKGQVPAHGKEQVPGPLV